MRNLKVAILVPEEDAGAPADRRDTFAQAEEIHQCLSRLGHQILTLVFGPDRARTANELLTNRFDCVVNLVEDLPEGPDQQYRVTECLDRFGIAYTGAGTAALKALGDKRRMKRRLRDAGLPVPADLEATAPLAKAPSPGWLAPSDLSPEGEVTSSEIARQQHLSRGGEVGPEDRVRGPSADAKDRRYIVKSAIEHASIGLDAENVVEGCDAARALLQKKQAEGGAWLAEQYIDGREFNVAILGSRDGPQVLPVAEILFLDHARRPKIVGYAEKWDAHSAAYAATPRVFPADPTDAALLSRLRALALSAWRLFGLAGYARVDFRVDEKGSPYILEVNANPCLAADAGFCAAAAAAGLTQTDVVAHLIETALAHAPSLAPDRRAGRP
jgi:D-alanine-D-alanine ligase